MTCRGCPTSHSAKTGCGWQAEALRRFTDYHEALAAPNRELFDKFVPFLGETFVRGIGGEWTNRPYVDDGSAYLGVRFPWTEYTLTIPTDDGHRRVGPAYRRGVGVWVSLHARGSRRGEARLITASSRSPVPLRREAATRPRRLASESSRADDLADQASRCGVHDVHFTRRLRFRIELLRPPVRPADRLPDSDRPRHPLLSSGAAASGR